MALGTVTAVVGAVVTVPVVRALLDEAARSRWRSGVLGVRSTPTWHGADTFDHDVAGSKVLVRVVPCVSALAVWEAVVRHERGTWLVVVTDRSEDDLGAGLLRHFVWNRLRTPDPWESVRHRFAATGVDPLLTAPKDHRDIAVGLLTATPVDGWPPAPGGVLTRDHALSAVARAHLGFVDADVDLFAVLDWTTDRTSTGRVADLRQLAGNALTDQALQWVAGRAGAVAGPVLHLLRNGAGPDAVPLGLVAGLLSQVRDAAETGSEHRQIAREALVRIEAKIGGVVPAAPVLRVWAAEASRVVATKLGDRGGSSGHRLLARADGLLAEVQAAGLAAGSDLLPAALTSRLAAVAAALRAAVTDPAGLPADVDRPQVSAAGEVAVEHAWKRVTRHRLAADDPRENAFRAAVRLMRWLAKSTHAATAQFGGRDAGGSSAGDALRLDSLITRQTREDSWVGSAVNDAAAGVAGDGLAAGLEAVLVAVRRRCDAHDRAFAAALAHHVADDPPRTGRTHAGVRHVEDLVRTEIVPIARANRAGVLLLVLDGASVSVMNEIVGDVLALESRGWNEALLPDQAGRAAAIAVLPTVTELSRASLLCGTLRRGGQDVERRGFHELAQSSGFAAGRVIHKKPLDSSRPGHVLADDVAAAIDDVTGLPLLACVLNTVDDALDRSDPGGTDWAAAAVRHLVPLLDRAQDSGRIVVLTSDHGHVVERRDGEQRRYPGSSSARSRSAEAPVGAGEVLVVGRRVLDHDGRAVLPYEERLRYGPLKAGYHGGASPAEVVVPVVVLVPGPVPDNVDLTLAPPQQPPWWEDPASVPTTEAAPSTQSSPEASTGTTGRSFSLLGSRPGRETSVAAQPSPLPTLFDEPASESAPSTVVPEASPVGAVADIDRGLAAAVVGSETYRLQKKVAGRVSVTDSQVRDLLADLVVAPDTRLAPTRAAVALAVAPAALRGAVLHVQRMLNVDGYAVLRVDADGATLVLDEQLLREQFDVPE